MIDRLEFEITLKSPIQFWGNLSKANVNRLLGPEVAQMIKYNQNNPHHCYDLFLHTLHTVENLGNNASDTLRIAAFFHDIGKPFVATQKHNKTVFHGHANKSAEIAHQLLLQMGYAMSEIERICFFIKHHDDFISWVLPSESYDRSNPYLIEISPPNLKSHIVKTMNDYACFETNEIHQLWGNLLLLCRADTLAQTDKVYRGRIVIDSKVHKLKKIESIEQALASLTFSNMYPLRHDGGE